MRRLAFTALLALCLWLPARAAQAADCTDAVKRIVTDHTEVSERKVAPLARLKQELEIDDTDDLVEALEEEFEMKIPAFDAERFVTVADIIAFANKNAKNTKNCK